MIAAYDHFPMTTELPDNFPTASQLTDDVYNSILDLGGSGSNQEIYARVKERLKLPFDPEKYSHLGSLTQTELYYRIAWAKTILKKQDRISNSRGVWSISSVDDEKQDELEEIVEDSSEDIEEFESWREELLNTLLEMDPYAFEKLAQRLLRECGFESVTVTKKSNDGGIDGYGKLKVNGIFCFNVAFQCKRYKDYVPSSDIRDFRGSLTQSIEKGVFITTSSFSESAKKEASDPGRNKLI